MNNSVITEHKRHFLIRELPAPLTRASMHIQLFDNYVPLTHLRLRNVRIPESKEWIYLFEHRVWEVDVSCTVTTIRLSETEHSQLEHLEGTEIRKNRYWGEFAGREAEFDVYLGKLWGLNRASVAFDSAEDAANFKYEDPEHLEITGSSFFHDESLVNRTIDDVRIEIERLSG